MAEPSDQQKFVNSLITPGAWFDAQSEKDEDPEIRKVRNRAVVFQGMLNEIAIDGLKMDLLFSGEGLCSEPLLVIRTTRGLVVVGAACTSYDRDTSITINGSIIGYESD